MADAKTYVKRFFDSLFQCASELDNNWKKEDLKILFGDLERLFSSDDVVETVQWNTMWYNIINSRVYYKLFIEKGEGSESSVKAATVFSEFSDREIPVKLEKELMERDEEIDGGRFVWVVQAKYCGPDIHKKDYDQSNMYRKKDGFEKLIHEVDIDGRIRNMFCYVEDGQKRERWICNAIDDPGNFYNELIKMNMKVIGTCEAYQIYEKYCEEGNWKKNYEKMCALIEQFPYKREKSEDTFLTYESYKKVVRILSDLLPVIEFTKDGKKKIKPYQQWKREQLTIAETVNERRMRIRIDAYEEKAHELVLGCLKMIKNVNRYEEFDKDIKDWYLNELDELNHDVYYKIRWLNGILRGAEKEDDMHKFVQDVLNYME